MARGKIGNRLALCFDEWPKRDCEAWLASHRSAEIFDKDGGGAHLKRKTSRGYEKAYSRFLGHLFRHGTLDPLVAPGARLTKNNLQGYVDELQGSVAPQTVVTLLRCLSAAILAIDPTADRSMLKRGIRRLARNVLPSRDKRGRLVPPRELLSAAIRRMARMKTERHAKADVIGGRFRDGLMMAVLALTRLRLGELAMMEVGRHLQRRDGGYYVVFAEGETKGGRPTDDELPAILTPFMDLYLSTYRVTLLRGRASDALWVSTYRRPMSEQTIYLRFRAATLEEIGKELTPHLVRDLSATGLAEERPDLIGILPAVLDHADERPGQKHYNHARKIAASRAYSAELMAQILTAQSEEASKAE